MPSDLVVALLNYLILGVNERGGRPTRTQLVKLLYLVDVEHQRRAGRTSTNLEWVFYHYGPYAFEIEPILQGLPDMEEEVFTSAKGCKGYTYRSEQDFADAESELHKHFSPLVKRVADRVLNEWALADLWELLDYVYFETEPMQDATRGRPLDFSKVVRAGPSTGAAAPGKLGAKTVADLRALAQQSSIREKGTPPAPAPYDEVYWEALRIMNQEDEG